MRAKKSKESNGLLNNFKTVVLAQYSQDGLNISILKSQSPQVRLGFPLPIGIDHRNHPRVILVNHFRIEQMEAVLAGWSMKLFKARQSRSMRS